MKTLRLLAVVMLAGWLLPSVQAQTSSNTLVRFRILSGQNLIGDIIVELFDHDKPITVGNFLSYLRSGAYKNTIIHRCEPGFVIQGGFVGVCNPYLAALFNTGFLVPTNPPIVNETFVGPLISNTFGTIAMATQGGDPNSAAASWFFNLSSTNASFLDTNNGGYCVFGRVKSGENVLSLFNLAHTVPVFFTAGEYTYQLSSLPVPYPQFLLPWYSHLFVVEITEMTNGMRTDALKPTVAITGPRLNSTFSNDTVTVSGTASDASGVKSVDVYLNLDCPITANGTTSWSLTLTNPPPGTNVVVVQSTDNIGNRSPIAYRTFFQSVRSPIRLSVDPPGTGTILGATDGQLLEINRRYVLTPRPEPGYLFAGWTGVVSQLIGPLDFYFQSNDTFTAMFVPNRFPLVKGVYNGLFWETNNVRPNSSGFLTLTLSDSVGFSGKVLMEGKTFRFANDFFVDGSAAVFVDRRPFSSMFLYVTFNVDLDNPNGVIEGEVKGLGTNGWTAGFRAYRQVTSGAPFTAKHTLLMPGEPDATMIPGGDSFGAVTVDALGKLKFTGTLADGTRLVQRTVLGTNGWWPLYVPLYAGKGSLLGWVQFDPAQPTTDLSGMLTWSKAAQSTARYARYYPAGFTNAVELIGSRYLPPVGTTASALNFAGGEVSFAGGNLAAPFTNTIVVGPGDKIVNSSPNKLTMNLARGTGLFAGSATPPNGTRALPFKGAWLQKAGMGGGFFLGTNESGQVSIRPQGP